MTSTTRAASKKTSPTAADQSFTLSDEDAALTEDASLSRLTWPILFSAFLSTTVAFTDSLALGGLAVRLTSGFAEADAAFLGMDVISSIPVILTLVLVTFGLNFVNTLVRERVSTGWDAARRMDLIRAFRHADFPTQSGYSGAGLSSSTEQIGRASGSIGAMVGLINTVVRTLIYIGIAFAISWQVSLIVVGAGGVLMTALRQLSRRTRRMHGEMARRYVHIGEEIGEMAISARELHSLNRWDETEGYLHHEISHIQRLKYLAATMAGMVGPIYWMGTLLVGIAVALGVDDSGTTTSGVAASGLLLIRSLTAAQSAQTMYQSYNDARPYVDRTRKVIAQLRRARRPTDGTAVPAGLVLRAEGADLTYGRDVVVPDLHLSLDGPGGVAIVGPSGGGKSTTLLALSGLGQPSRGEISINGVSLAALDGTTLGARIGLLPQHPQLLRGSLRSNLVRPEVERTDEELWDALRAVGLEATVRGFDGRMDSPMGRAAEGFSGGELQRLGLARLLVNEPDVWLVDEPTSALDKENSARVLELLWSAMERHLVVVVTHRPELLHSCKRIVYIDGGRVIDDGDLDAVAARQPFVASMVHSHQEPTSQTG